MMVEREVLEKARKLIEAGWTQHSYYEDNCYCAMGALVKAKFNKTPITALKEIDELDKEGYIDYLSSCIPVEELKQMYNTYAMQFTPEGNIYEYNDASSTTKEKILEVFDCAIKNLKNIPDQIDK